MRFIPAVLLSLALVQATLMSADALASAGGSEHAPARAAVQSYLAELTERARQARLAEHPVWLALLHFEKGRLLRGGRSHATTAAFFLSPEGRRDPQAELVATLASFALPADTRLKREEHPQCAFVARRHWLAHQLQIDTDRLPFSECQHYENWRRGLRAVGLSLIFPEGFMNNPASMFGHTLLRIDESRELGAQEMLGYAVDFTANAGGDSGLGYVAKGVLGRYPGYFGVHPYYQQLKRYADWENRDIWEYRLEITDQELDFLLMHLWELRGVSFPYYFFTKNCSYQLLKLLDVGMPALRLSEGFPRLVIPVDTVRAVVERPAVVRGVRYRPSPATQFRHDLRHLSRRDRRRVREIAEGRLEPAGEELAGLPAPKRALLLGLAYDRLRYAFLAGQVDEEASRGLSRRILIARSRAGVEAGGEPILEGPARPLVRPDEGHASARAVLAAGWRDGESFVDVELRPAFHGLMDAEGGFVKHMQIRFLDARVRYYPTVDRVRLQELAVIEAVSLSPRSNVFRPLAWKFGTGVRTRRVPAADSGALRDTAVWTTELAAGLAYDPHRLLLTYGLATMQLDAGPGLDDGASFGPGALLGLYLSTPGDRWKLHLFGSVTRFALGDPTTSLRVGVEQRLSLTRNTALTLAGGWRRIARESWFETRLGVNLHF